MQVIETHWNMRQAVSYEVKTFQHKTINNADQASVFIWKFNLSWHDAATAEKNDFYTEI